MSKGKILVLDDSPLVRKLAEVSLQEAGYDVYTAGDGEEGLKIAEEVKPDLILVDFIMPKMTGAQVCKLIRENEVLKEIPIILITGKGETVGQTFIEKYGVLDYFIKPFKSEELVDKINQVLGKIPQIKETTEEIPAFSFEPSEIELKSEEETESFELSESELQESISLPETEEISLSEEKEIDLTEKIELEEIKLKEDTLEQLEPSLPVEDLIEPGELEILEKSESFEIEELKLQDIKPAEDLIEESTKTEIEETKLAFDLTALEKIIDNKLDNFYEKITSLFDSTVEATLKKYGLIKDYSVILSGSLNFFRISEIFDLINSKNLNGIFYAFGNGVAYEFLFINGKVIYGISNLQKQKIGSKLLKELSDEEIKNFTVETLSYLKNITNGSFIFEKKDFSQAWLLNKPGYTPLELFSENIIK